MPGRWLISLLFLGLGWLGLSSRPVQAAIWKMGAVTGLMQQPTSSYYHLVYGGALDVGTENEKILVRGSYLERPRFATQGYWDQEFFSVLLLGTQLWNSKSQHLYGFFGFGHASGVIGETAEGGDDRHFGLSGPSVAVDYLVRWNGFEWAIGHQSLLGHKSEIQAQSFVIWPYNFFLMKLGWAI